MGQVIHVAFGTEREWEQTHAKTVDGLVAIGTLFGDDEALMRALPGLRASIQLLPVDVETRFAELAAEEQSQQESEEGRG